MVSLEELLQPGDWRLDLLCASFVGWSILGWFIGVWAFFLPLLIAYPIVHLLLAIFILRRTGLRPWAICLCVSGLLFGECYALLTIFMFMTWLIHGFV